MHGVVVPYHHRSMHIITRCASEHALGNHEHAARQVSRPWRFWFGTNATRSKSQSFLHALLLRAAIIASLLLLAVGLKISNGR
jgi:hypothetical protein